MSEDSSDSKVEQTKKKPEGWGFWGALLLGVTSFVLPVVVVATTAPIVSSVNLSQYMANFIYLVLFEAACISAVYIFVRSYGLRLPDIGLGKFKSKYLGLAALGFLVYFPLSIAISTISGLLFRYDQSQPQDLGFAGAGGFDLIPIFIGVVILVPIAEELLFRGFIFFGFRRRTSFWASALLVSALFALVHGQWNVAFDVFALSLVLCYLREKSGSIWPGIVLHATKNALAFLLVYVLKVSTG